MILVFNKYDLLLKHRPHLDEDGLLRLCFQSYKPIISLLRGICNPARVCEVSTILDRKNMARNNRGAPIVMGEATRAFVESIAGTKVVQQIVKDSASNKAGPMFF